MRALFHLILFSVANFASARADDINQTTGTSGLIMIDKRGNLVRFFDPNTYREISTLSIDGTPHELAISPDHKTAYVPNYGDGVYGNNPHPGHTIAVIDLPTRTLRGTIDISPYVAPHGLQVDPRGTLFVTCDISRKLLVIDPVRSNIVAAIDTDGTGHWVSVLPDGSKAYVANKNDRLFVSVIDLRQKKILTRIPMPNGTQGISTTPDGKQVFAMDFTKPTIAVIDTKTDKVVDVVELTGDTKGAWRAKLSPDNRTAISINVAERTATLMQTSDLKHSQIKLTVGSQPFGIAYTADSRRALVSNHGDGTVSVIDISSRRVVDTIKAGVGIETLSFY